MRAAILGASGYTGLELMRLIAGHPGLEPAILAADTQRGAEIATVAANLARAYDGRRFDAMPDPSDVGEALDGIDVVFLALPHEVSHDLVPDLLAGGRCVVDLSAAYRLRAVEHYQRYYGFQHQHLSALNVSVYGLPEKYRNELATARLIATPGCYVTAAVLALEPFASAGFVDEAGAIVDAASGVSGAGAKAQSNTMFVTVDQDMCAYGLLDHRHTPEMEQEIGTSILFTPHLVPMTRGILSTCYFSPLRTTSTAEVLDLLHERYRDEPFVVVTPEIPHTKATMGSNLVVITARFDERTGRVMVISALDNLTKGAAGGAIQSANLALGFEETVGLSAVGMMP